MKNFTLAVALLITFSVQSQIGMGTPNPDPSAVLELASTQKGFLPPRLTTLQRNAIVQPAEGLTIYNTDKDCLEWYIASQWYNSCGDNLPAVVANYTCSTLETGTMTAGDPVYGVSQTITADVSAPGSYDISATNNGVTFSAKGYFTSKGNHDVILRATGIPVAIGFHKFTLNTTPGCDFERPTIDATTVVGNARKIWMAYNLGATAPATSSTDITQYGDLYQWGRRTDGHEKFNSPLTTTLSSTDDPNHDKFITVTVTPYDWRSTANDALWQGAGGANNPCPAGFRIPTLQEWEDEFTASNIVDPATAYNSVLKLPLARYRQHRTGSYVSGTDSYYWTSDIDPNTYPYNIKISVNGNGTRSTYRGFGLSVRCIQD